MADTRHHKTVLITGAARRVGRAIALNMAAHGWSVGIHYRRSEEEAERLAEKIRAAGGTAAALPGNLANMDDVQSLIPRCASALEPPTCLINNCTKNMHAGRYPGDANSDSNTPRTACTKQIGTDDSVPICTC